jgi:hypothetical protein
MGSTGRPQVASEVQRAAGAPHASAGRTLLLPPGGLIMTDGSPLAFLDLSGLQAAIFFVVRVVLGALAGFLTWLAAGPLLRLLHRLVFRRPARAVPVTVGRVAAAILVGVLVFLYFPIGGGGLGWGWGPGSGGGPGAGPGEGGTARDSGAARGEPTRTQKTEKAGKDVLTVEMIPSKAYTPGSKRYYLVEEGRPRTLEEVEMILKKGQGRWGQVRIVIYANSIAEEHPAVRELEQLAERYDLTVSRAHVQRDRKLPSKSS